MPEAQAAAADKASAQKLVTELKVSGHLMTLDAGLFCIVQSPSRAADARSGLPGVRVSLPPGSASRPDAVTISTFRPDGWLHGGGDAALVRVVGGPAQMLVTVYQAPNAKDGAPNLQVMRLLEPGPAGRPGTAAGGGRCARPGRGARPGGDGDGRAYPGTRRRRRDARRLARRARQQALDRGVRHRADEGSPPKDIEYQAVLGKRLAVALGRGRPVLRQPRHGAADPRAAGAAARRRRREIRVPSTPPASSTAARSARWRRASRARRKAWRRSRRSRCCVRAKGAAGAAPTVPPTAPPTAPSTVPATAPAASPAAVAAAMPAEAAPATARRAPRRHRSRRPASRSPRRPAGR